MRILHLSDTHGTFPKLSLKGVDLVVHSGDILPNITKGNVPVEEAFQEAWICNHRQEWQAWVGNLPFYFCTGNHDFLSGQAIQECLNQNGILAHHLNHRFREFQGVSFFGFPFTPYFQGEWNDELSSRMMENALLTRLEIWHQQRVDILVSHGPLYGVLDEAHGECLGSWDLRDTLLSLPMEKRPKHVLHGHIHEDGGKHAIFEGMAIWNAACSQHILEI